MARMPPNIWKPAFLTALAETGIVSAAADRAGIDRGAAYAARARSAKFAKDWDNALQRAADALEAEALRRAAMGVEEPVYYQGKIVGTVTKYSDVLMMFLLKGMRPEKFRENHHHSGGLSHEHKGEVAPRKVRLELVHVDAESRPQGWPEEGSEDDAEAAGL